eukprot:GHVP01020065.1.p2 GENE.GHVP01020065.1~~GHVP01020065.1.p2  ORF type:complete len:100 (+),score=1.90 GHVP01020065.1:935-1234(+)
MRVKSCTAFTGGELYALSNCLILSIELILSISPHYPLPTPQDQHPTGGRKASLSMIGRFLLKGDFKLKPEASTNDDNLWIFKEEDDMKVCRGREDPRSQ